MRIKNYIYPVISTVSVYSLTQFLVEVSTTENLKIFESLDSHIIVPLVGFIVSFIFLFALMVVDNLKLQKGHEKSKPSYDKEYIQEYIKVVGTYLEAEVEKKERNLYGSMAAGIYLHTPKECWDLIDKIDEEIASGNLDDAWKELKTFSKYLVKSEGKIDGGKKDD